MSRSGESDAQATSGDTHSRGRRPVVLALGCGALGGRPARRVAPNAAVPASVGGDGGSGFFLNTGGVPHQTTGGRGDRASGPFGATRPPLAAACLPPPACRPTWGRPGGNLAARCR